MKMQNNNVITAINLAKTYRIYTNPRHRLYETFHPLGKVYHKKFVALTGVNFTVGKGESFAIIGRNGSGKSTLLQLIAGILTPSHGKVDVCGNIAALLELGAGFNPEFTGRENVYMNGAILGFSKAEMDAKFDAIAAFADIGDFLEQPVKQYSSGMYVRLAFAVQACVEPDILIVDEALSVGDVFFQQKCLRRMQELREGGTALLFVSHDMAAVRDLCERTLYLKKGNVEYLGETQVAVQKYFQEDLIVNTDATVDDNDDEDLAVSSNSDQFPVEKLTDCIWVRDDLNGEPSKTSARIVGVALTDTEGGVTTQAKIGERVIFKIYYTCKDKLSPQVSLTLKNRYDQVVTSTGSYLLGITPPLLENSVGCFELEVDCSIESGQYTFNASLSLDGNKPNRGVQLDETPWIGPVTISWDYENERAPFLGMVQLPVKGCFKGDQ